MEAVNGTVSCYLPTTRPNTQLQQEGILPIPHSEVPTTWVPAKGNSVADAALTAWALVLRAYLRDDQVSFVRFHASSKAICAEADSTDSAYRVIDSMQLLYNLSDEDKLAEVPLLRTVVQSSRGQNHLRVNTGVLLVPAKGTVNDNYHGLRKRMAYSSSGKHEQIHLMLYMCISESHIKTTISYITPNISKRYARAIGETYRSILRQILDHPEGKVGDIDLVSPGDLNLMTVWNPRIPFSRISCMHHLVEESARKSPNAEALCSWDGTMTYTELDHASEIFAAQLLQAGVSPGDYVPFAFEKSLWTVVATLAVLKAGAAFVPLDQSNPEQRLRQILETVEAKIVMTSETLSHKFAAMVDTVLIVSPSTANIYRALPVEKQPTANVEPSDPIFVLFTSGSTGMPKGMVHEHAAICTHTLSHGEAMGYEKARVLQFAAHTFDVAIIDMFTTLVFGGCVCIPSEESRQSGIVSVINSMRVDFAILTPLVAGLIEPSEVPTLKTLAVGGEALPEDHVKRWAGHVRFIQIYGPAEVGICLVIDMIEGSTRPQTVGYTISNSSCWLVDPNDPHKLVPIGAVGELVVAGPSLARKYIKNDQRTNEAFLNGLAWAEDLCPNMRRFYRTGDLLRLNTDRFDGSYDFVNRKDHQIKLRGQRLEPGEIEYHLACIDGVEVPVVMVPKSGCLANELVAVIQTRNGRAQAEPRKPLSIVATPIFSTGDIRALLAPVLAEFLLPSLVIEVTSLPSVASLKVDRKRILHWLENIPSRAEVDMVTTALHKFPQLQQNELVANEISGEIGKIVAQKDNSAATDLKGRDVVLEAIGLDSVQVMSLAIFIKRAFHVQVPLRILLNPGVTLRHIASYVQAGGSAATAYGNLISCDIRQESHAVNQLLFQHLPNTCLLRPGTTRPSIRKILLTGATGYLGMAICRQLLKREGMSVCAIVRPEKCDSGLDRLVRSAKEQGWWNETYRSRLTVWGGDLASKLLGLKTDELRALEGASQEESEWIDTIIHNGATVHYNSSYEALKAANVISTLEITKLAAASRSVSSLTFVSGGIKPGTEVTTKGTNYDKCDQLNINEANGYAQTKYVSEQMVLSCATHPAFRQKSVRVIQPGYIIGSVETCNPKHTDFIWRLISGCIEIGAYSLEQAGDWLAIADADYVANRVIECATASSNAGLTEPVLEGLHFSDMWTVLVDEFGYSLEGIAFDAWMARLRQAIDLKQEAHPLFPLLPTLEKDGRRIGSNTVSCKSPTRMKEVFRHNVERLIETAFLPVPPQAKDEGKERS